MQPVSTLISSIVSRFPDGYSQAGQTNNTLNTIKWGSDYLLECVGSGANGSSIVYQMGNLTISEMNWQAPEDITGASSSHLD